MYYFVIEYLHSWHNIIDGRERKMVKYIITLKPNLMMEHVQFSSVSWWFGGYSKLPVSHSSILRFL
jgi:hypothetical protein